MKKIEEIGVNETRMALTNNELDFIRLKIDEIIKTINIMIELEMTFPRGFGKEHNDQRR